MSQVKQFVELSNSELEENWLKTLNGNLESFNLIKQHYMNELIRIKPLYQTLNDKQFYSLLEQSVLKAIERGVKFQIIAYQSYIPMASQIYFKALLQPDVEQLNLPLELIRAFFKLDDVYKHIPELALVDESNQILLLSKGFEYPIFPTRLLFYSFKKWKNNAIRQVDIDLTVSLLPTPQRIEWEVFYEKKLDDIENTIKKELGE